jgi:fructokinase
MNHELEKVAVCFGEILWDILPSGAKPGGAPMNVAYHLKKLGIDPLLITKVGLDDYGRKLIDLLGASSIDTDYFQIDDTAKTGVVYAKPNEFNEVVYDIVYPVAWDFINLEDEVKILVGKSKYFIYGSLIARNKKSRETLYELLELANNRILDINLRAPHYNKDTVSHLLTKAHTAKLNIAELELITGWYGSTKTTFERIQLLQDEFDIQTIIVTRGAEGAVINFKGQLFEHPGFKVSVEDTVGSGDAFLAAFIHSQNANDNLGEALISASRLGAYVATKAGACPYYCIQYVENFFYPPLKQPFETLV